MPVELRYYDHVDTNGVFTRVSDLCVEPGGGFGREPFKTLKCQVNNASSISSFCGMAFPIKGEADGKAPEMLADVV